MARSILVARASIESLSRHRRKVPRGTSRATTFAASAHPSRFALQRHFKVTEKLNLRFLGEFFDLFNHPNFGSPNNPVSSPLFGYSTQTLANSLGTGRANGGLNPLYQIGGPRSIQLALKLQF